MNQQQRNFTEQFDAMDTDLLLQRYRSGGLLPDADVALLLVLESRGYSRERVDEKLRMDDAAVVKHDAAMQEAPAKPKHGAPVKPQTVFFYGSVSS